MPNKMKAWPKHVKLVSWDVDGTLYSLSKMKLILYGLVLKETAKGHAAIVRRDFKLLREHREMIARVRQSGGVLVQDNDAREQLSAISKRWFSEAIGRTGPRPGLVELVEFIHSLGLEQVVYSDFACDYKLEVLGLKHLFRKVYVGESAGFVKPSPKILQQIALDAGVPVERVLHIGDRPDADEHAANAAGCESLIVGRDFRDYNVLLSALERG